ERAGRLAGEQVHEAFDRAAEVALGAVPGAVDEGELRTDGGGGTGRVPGRVVAGLRDGDERRAAPFQGPPGEALVVAVAVADDPLQVVARRGGAQGERQPGLQGGDQLQGAAA